MDNGERPQVSEVAVNTQSALAPVLAKLTDQQWQVAPEEGAPTSTTQDMVNAPWADLAAQIVPKLEAGEKPTAAETAALWRKYIDGQVRLKKSKFFSYDEVEGGDVDTEKEPINDQGDSASTEENSVLSEIDGAEKGPIEFEDPVHQEIEAIHRPTVDQSPTRLYDPRQPHTEVDEVMDVVTIPSSKLFPRGFQLDSLDNNYVPHIISLSSECAKRLSSEEQQKLYAEIAPYFMSEYCDYEERECLVHELFPKDFYKAPLEEKARIARPFLEVLWNREISLPANLTLDEARSHYHELHQLRDSLTGIMGGVLYMEDVPKTIEPWLLFLSEKDDFEKMTRQLGTLISPKEYPYLINSVRHILKTRADLPDENRERLKKLGIMLLGYDPNDDELLFNELGELYAAIKFELYTANTDESTIREADIVEAVDGKNTLILGSGTGRHIIELLRRQKGKPADEKRNYLGLEINPRHVNVSRERLTEEHLGLGDGSEVRQGSWYQIPLEDESQDAVVSNGRDIPHVETEELGEKLMQEAYRVLKPGGLFEFDMANVKVGDFYQQSSQRFETVLRALKMPESLIRYTMEQELGYTIDGPNAKMRYNRLNFTPETMLKFVERVNMHGSGGLGFVCTVLRTNPIDDGHGSENVVYLAWKPDIEELGFPAEDLALLKSYKEERRQLMAIDHSLIEVLGKISLVKSTVSGAVNENSVVKKAELTGDALETELAQNEEYLKLKRDVDELGKKRADLLLEATRKQLAVEAIERQIKPKIREVFQRKVEEVRSRIPERKPVKKEETGDPGENNEKNSLE